MRCEVNSFGTGLLGQSLSLSKVFRTTINSLLAHSSLEGMTHIPERKKAVVPSITESATALFYVAVKSLF